MQYVWTNTRKARQWVRVKEVDLSYCLQCKHSKHGYRMRFDFCCYDGMQIDQSDDENFEFWCFHYDHWRSKEIPQY